MRAIIYQMPPTRYVDINVRIYSTRYIIFFFMTIFYHTFLILQNWGVFLDIFSKLCNNLKNKKGGILCTLFHHPF